MNVSAADQFRDRVYRIVFTLAGCYNLAFGAWAGFRPKAFFELVELDPPRHPAIWSCLGMVVGIYGLLYLYAAWQLRGAWPIIAVGLLGKVLGPVGLAVTVTRGELPLRMLSLIVLNDFLWWLPLGLFLLEGTRLGKGVRASAPYVCAALHTLALVALVWALPGGTEAEPDVQQRAGYITDNVGLWRAGWALWMASAVSLLGFYAWWAARIAAPQLAVLALLVAGLGLACDLFGESLFLAWLPDRAEQILRLTESDAEIATRRFLNLQRLGTMLTAVIANGLYTFGGILLTLGTRSLEGRLLALAWVLWIAGIGMSVSASAGSVTGIMVSSAVLFPLLVPFCVLLGRKLR